MYIYIGVILQFQKVHKKCHILFKRTKTSIVPIVFNDVLFPVHAVLFPSLTIPSTLYGKNEVVTSMQGK